MSAQSARFVLLAVAVVLHTDLSGRRAYAQVGTGTVPAALLDHVQKFGSGGAQAVPTAEGSPTASSSQEPSNAGDVPSSTDQVMVLQQRQQQLEQLQKLQDLQRQQLLLRQQEVALVQQPQPPPQIPSAPLHQIVLVPQPQPPAPQKQPVFQPLPPPQLQHQLQPRPLRMEMTETRDLPRTEGGVVDFIPPEHRAAAAGVAKSQPIGQQVRHVVVRPAPGSMPGGQQSRPRSAANQQAEVRQVFVQQPPALSGRSSTASEQSRPRTIIIIHSPVNPESLLPHLPLQPANKHQSPLPALPHHHPPPPAKNHPPLLLSHPPPPANNHPPLPALLPPPPPPPANNHQHFPLPPPPPPQVAPSSRFSGHQAPQVVNHPPPQLHHSVPQPPVSPVVIYQDRNPPRTVPQQPKTLHQHQDPPHSYQPSPQLPQEVVQLLRQNPSGPTPKVIYLSLPSSHASRDLPQSFKGVQPLPESFQTKGVPPQVSHIVYRVPNPPQNLPHSPQVSKQPAQSPQVLSRLPSPPVVVQQPDTTEPGSEVTSSTSNPAQVNQQIIYHVSPSHHASPAASIPVAFESLQAVSHGAGKAQPVTYVIQDPRSPHTSMDAGIAGRPPPSRLPPSLARAQFTPSNLAPFLQNAANWEHHSLPGAHAREPLPPPAPAYGPTGWEHNTAPAGSSATASSNQQGPTMAPGFSPHGSTMTEVPSYFSSGLAASRGHGLFPAYQSSHRVPEMVMPPQLQSAALRMARDMGVMQYYESHGCVDPTLYLPPGTKTVGLALGCSSPHSEHLCSMAGRAVNGARGAAQGPSQSLVSLMTPPSTRHLLETCLSPAAMKKMMMGMSKGGGGKGGGGMDPMMMMMMMMGGGGSSGGSGMLATMAMMNMMKGGANSGTANPNGPPAGITDSQPLEGSQATQAPAEGPGPDPAASDPLAQCKSVLPMLMMGSEGGLMTAEGAEVIADTRRQLMPFRCQEMKAGLVPFRMCCPGHVNAPSFMDIAMSPSALA